MANSLIVAKNVQTSSFSFFRACWILLLTAFVLGMTYLWLQSRVMEASWKIKELEKEILQLQPVVSGLEVKLARLQTPAVIKAKLEAAGIEMDAPGPGNIVRITPIRGERRTAIQRHLQPNDIALLSVNR
jgi:hypothetical protein